jgi:enamine deaminase RidA (YjgF/YER057c/UK114 family)
MATDMCLLNVYLISVIIVLGIVAMSMFMDNASHANRARQARDEAFAICKETKQIADRAIEANATHIIEIDVLKTDMLKIMSEMSGYVRAYVDITKCEPIPKRRSNRI